MRLISIAGVPCVLLFFGGICAIFASASPLRHAEERRGSPKRKLPKKPHFEDQDARAALAEGTCN